MLLRALVPALLLCALSVAPAWAGTATVVRSESGATVSYVLSASGAPGEINSLSVRVEDGALAVRDARSPLGAGPGCEPVTTMAVRCPVPAGQGGGAVRVGVGSVDLGDRDDDWTAPDGPTPLTVTGTITGGAGADRIRGGLTVDAGPGDDCVEQAGTAVGGAGNDNLQADVATGGEGDDVVIGRLLDGGPGRDLLRGTAGADTIDAGPGDDLVDAAAGDDTIRPGLGGDVVDGGEGTDFVTFVDALGPVRADLSKELRDPAGEGDAIGDLEGVEGGPFADVLLGSEAGERILGGAGDDTIEGLGGPDRLGGGVGADTVLGGDGDDALDGGAGVDVVLGGAGNDELDGSGDGVERLGCGVGARDVLAAPGRRVVPDDCERVAPFPAEVATEAIAASVRLRARGVALLLPAFGAGAAGDVVGVRVVLRVGGTVLARRTVDLVGGARRRSVLLRPTPAGLRRLRRARSVRVELRIGAGATARTASVRLRLRAL